MINFFLLLLLIGPGRSHKLDLLLRKTGLADVITVALQRWFVGATFLATAVFVWGQFKTSDRETQEATKTKTLDGAMLLGWWIALVAMCLYAYMMGMGG